LPLRITDFEAIAQRLIHLQAFRSQIDRRDWSVVLLRRLVFADDPTGEAGGAGHLNGKDDVIQSEVIVRCDVDRHSDRQADHEILGGALDDDLRRVVRNRGQLAFFHLLVRVLQTIP